MSVKNIVEILVDIFVEIIIENMHDRPGVITTRPLSYRTNLYLEKEKKTKKRDAGKLIPRQNLLLSIVLSGEE